MIFILDVNREIHINYKEEEEEIMLPSRSDGSNDLFEVEDLEKTYLAKRDVRCELKQTANI